VPKPRIYIETTIPSYLTARKSHDILVAAHQQITGEWWTLRRQNFDLFTSELVWKKPDSETPTPPDDGWLLLRGIPLLDLTPAVRRLAGRFLAGGLIPAKAADDALHVAFATAHGMDLLLTWNCRHIANAEIIARLADAAAEFGHRLPVLCTREPLMGG
jgi:predicted nucleic acid-binding protein